MEGVLSFPGLSRYKEELQPLSEKRGMGFFSKLARIAQIFETNRGGANLP